MIEIIAIFQSFDCDKIEFVKQESKNLQNIIDIEQLNILNVSFQNLKLRKIIEKEFLFDFSKRINFDKGAAKFLECF